MKQIQQRLSKKRQNLSSRNEYWRHGSVCEDYGKIKCPVLLIGGFADLYTDPVFRLMDHLQCPKRAIIGPWGHQWPYVTVEIIH